jgi:adenylate cyclase
MSSGNLKHRLAALLSADVVGYSRLMAEDELGTIRTLTAYRAEITALVESHGGRVVNFVGDNMLAEFPYQRHFNVQLQIKACHRS